MLAFGEIGLGGEIRAVNNCEQRIKEAAKLGFRKCVVPKYNLTKIQKNFKEDIEFYKERYRSDILSGTTQYGCHRDDIKFYKNNEDFETTSSQGEMRMLSLSIKLALADMLKNMKGESPVVLLDDVFSELDKNHQNRLLSVLDKSMQIIITTTDILKLGKLALDNAKVFMINHGTVKEIENNG